MLILFTSQDEDSEKNSELCYAHWTFGEKKDDMLCKPLQLWLHFFKYMISRTSA